MHFAFPVENEDLLWQRIESFRPFEAYCRNMDPEFDVKSITIESILWFGKPMSRIGFMVVNTKIHDEEGTPVSGIAFLRGPSVVIPLILRDEESNDFLVLTEQARPAVGERRLLEMIAGTLDGEGNVTGKAVAEVEEETGIRIGAQELVDLVALAFGPECPGIYASPGASDEAFLYYGCVKRMTRAQIDAIRGRLAGNSKENEKIVVRVITPEEAIKELHDAKSLTGLVMVGLGSEELGLD